MATGSGAGNLRLIEAATVSAALQGGATDAPPDVIALLQSYPGQWSEAAVEALHGAWPLARLVMLLGSWCEGETRTGHPCCGVWRLFWYEFVPALERHLAGAGRATDSWGLPRLATAMERLAWDVERLAPPEHRAKGLVVVAARSLAAYEAWEDACAAWGYATVWQRPGGGLRGQGACAGIWDAADPSEGEWREMSAFARRWSPARILFALGFPRLADALRAERLGARLLSKPTALPDLWWNLEQATRPTATIVSTAEVTAVKSLDDVTTTRLQSPELLDVD